MTEKRVTACCLSTDGPIPVYCGSRPKRTSCSSNSSRELEPRLGPDDDLGPIADWGSKLAGAVVRIAGLLHLAANLETGYRDPISAETFVAAQVRLATTSSCTRSPRTRSWEQTPQPPTPSHWSAWIRMNDTNSFSKRAARITRTQFGSPEGCRHRGRVNLLERHGWIRRHADPPEVRQGRPRSPVYHVNPALFEIDRVQRPTEPTKLGICRFCRFRTALPRRCMTQPRPCRGLLLLPTCEAPPPAHPRSTIYDIKVTHLSSEGTRVWLRMSVTPRPQPPIPSLRTVVGDAQPYLAHNCDYALVWAC